MPPPTLLEEREHRCQKLFFGMALDQSCAELAQHRSIKARVGEFESQGILPSDATAHRICGLPIGKSFSKLHDGHSC
jgi:hypothetical protein